MDGVRVIVAPPAAPVAASGLLADFQQIFVHHVIDPAQVVPDRNGIVRNHNVVTGYSASQ